MSDNTTTTAVTTEVSAPDIEVTDTQQPSAQEPSILAEAVPGSTDPSPEEQKSVHNPYITDILSTSSTKSRNQTLKEIQIACRSIMNHIRSEHQDITQSMMYLKYLCRVFLENGFPDDIMEYLKTSFFQNAVVTLMKREHTYFNGDWNMSEEVLICCKLFVQIAVPLIKEDSELAMEIIYNCMNSNMPFFRHFGHDWRQRRGLELTAEEIEKLAEWRKTNVKVNNHVDYLLGNRWRYGKVKRVHERHDHQNNKYYVLEIVPDQWGMYPQFNNRRRNVSGEQEEIIDTFTFSSQTYGQIAPPASKSIEYRPHMSKWRLELSVGGHCDVLDAVHKWYTCTILELDEGANRFKINYDGWSTRYDEFIERTEMKCQPHQSQATGGRESGGVQGSLDELEPSVALEDTQDPPDTFAVDRGNLSGVSSYMVDIYNAFGKAGGFDEIEKRFADRENNIPCKNLRFIISALSKGVKIYSKQIADVFIPRMHVLVFEILESLTDIQIRELKSEYLERIVIGVDLFLTRYKSEDERAQITEEFQLKMALRRLKCATIERRVNGVTYIADICQRTRKHGYQYQSRFINSEYLMLWIEENKLLELLFDKKSHPQLMKCSLDILKFICSESDLKISHLEIIWSSMERAASKSDDVENELQTLCSLIENLTFYLETPHFDFLFTKFEQINMRLFTIHHLKLMNALSRNTQKNSNSDPADRCLNILWKIVQEKSMCELEIVDQAKILIRECLASIFTQELRLPLMLKCIANLEAHESVCSSLELLASIVSLYPRVSHMNNDPERWTIIEHLASQGLLTHFFNDIIHFKNAAKKVVAGGKFPYASVVDEEKENNAPDVDGNVKASSPSATSSNTFLDENINESTMFGRSTYMQEIEQRLKFLTTILDNNGNMKLENEQIDTLWDVFIVNALSRKEREHGFLFFKEQTLNKRAIMNFQTGAADHFFQLILKDVQPHSITLSAYECYEQYFILVNCSKNFLQMLANSKSFHVHNYDELSGLDMLWKIALNANEETVHKKSFEFLTNICIRLSHELKNKIVSIRHGILDKIFKELRMHVSNSNVSQITRTIDLIHSFLNASESRGMGGLRPHNALSSGKKWQLKIIDRINFNGFGRPSSFTIYIHENDSLWDLREIIAVQAKTYPELVTILHRGRFLNESKNSTSIAELNIRDSHVVYANKRDRRADRVALVSGQPPSLVPQCKAALLEIFNKFCTNSDNSMSTDDFRRYILACGAGESSASKNRIQNIFAQNGTQPGGYQDRLSLPGFYNFYRQACIDRVDHVWNDLVVFDFRYDLRKEQEARIEEESLLHASPEMLPRWILISNEEYFNLLFTKCLATGNSDVVAIAWSLLLRLPTNPKMYKTILDLNESVPNGTKSEWEKLLPSDDIFTLVYSLLICESLTITPESNVNEQELEIRVKWRQMFLEKKGFEHLISILHNFEYAADGKNENTDSKADTADDSLKHTKQLALTSILKMVHSFFIAAVASNPDMKLLVEQIRSLNDEENEKNENITNSNTDNTKKAESKSQSEKDKGGPDGEYYELETMSLNYSGYGPNAYPMSADEDLELNKSSNTANLTSLLEKQFENAVRKASEMPEDMFNEGQYIFEQLGEQSNEPGAGRDVSGGGGGGGGGEGDDMIGPMRSGEVRQRNISLDESRLHPENEEKAGREEKVRENDGENKDEDGDEMGGDLPVEEKEDEKPPPLNHRQLSIKFAEMVEMETGKYSKSLLSCIDFHKLLMQLLNILKLAANDANATQQRDLVVRHAVRLWVSLLLYKPTLLPELFETLKTDPSFILSAIQSKDQELGSEFAKSIRKLCHFVEDSPNYTEKLKSSLPPVRIVQFFLRDILVANLPSSSTEIDPEQHFYLLIALMQEYTDKYNGTVAEFDNLFDYLTSQLLSYKSREVFEDYRADKVLVGLMTLLSVLLAGHAPYRVECANRGLLEKLCTKFVFATGKTLPEKDENLPICKTSASRKLAYRLLVQCCIETPVNFQYVWNKVQMYQSDVKVPDGWEYAPDRNTRSKRGYVGLKNLGSTCYMNSLLQQFFMMPHFRNALLYAGQSILADDGKLVSSGSDDSNSGKAEEKKEEVDIEDNLLYQVMRMFSFLSLSDERAYDTTAFCTSYKDENGRPIDVRIQQDVQEFFNIVTDRIEENLKGTKYRYLIKDCFGGKVVNQMICQGGCNKIREREQDFVMISLPIKNRSNIEESLEAYVQSESLDGVSCDHCKKKCTTLKREVMHTLPNTIFFHLKRFELNFETFRHEKSNQRFEFPMEINLEPFTKEGMERNDALKNSQQTEENSASFSTVKSIQQNISLQKSDNEEEKERVIPEQYSKHPKQYYDYHLVGVVIHSGSAEAGHYFSYIKDRKTGDWNEFNDSMIKPFDASNLDSETFGGKKKGKSKMQGQWGGDWEHETQRIQNGYILVYDRKDCMVIDHAADIQLEIEAIRNKAKKEAEEAAPDDQKKESESKDNEIPVETPAVVEEDEEVIDPPFKEPVCVQQYMDEDTKNIVNSIGPVFDEVLDSNVQFMKNRQIYNVQYFQFLYELSCVCSTPGVNNYDDDTKDNTAENNNEDENDSAADTDTVIGRDGSEYASDDPVLMFDKISSSEMNPALSVIQMTTFTVFQNLARTCNKTQVFNRFITYLKFLYGNNIPACKWFLNFLSAKRSYIAEHILTTRDLPVMHGFSELVIHILKTLSTHESTFLMVKAQGLRYVLPFNNKGRVDYTADRIKYEGEISSSCSSKFMDILLELMEIVPKHWFRFAYYFKVIYEYAMIGSAQRHYLISNKLISALGDFYLGNRSPYNDPSNKKIYPIMGSRMYPPKFDTVIQIISVLLRACQTPSIRTRLQQLVKSDSMPNDEREKLLQLSPTSLSYTHNAGNDSDDIQWLHPLAKEDEQLPHCRYFYEKMINEAHHSRDILDALNNITCHWSFEDLTFSEEVSKIITEGVDKSGAEQVRTYLCIMHEFINIEDDIIQQRFQLLHHPKQGVLYFIHCYRTQHQPFSYTSIGAVLDMMKSNEHYMQFMFERRSEWQWWDVWLDAYCHRRPYYQQNNSDLMKQKIQFFDDYKQLLADHGIECGRCHVQQHQQQPHQYNQRGGGRGGALQTQQMQANGNMAVVLSRNQNHMNMNNIDVDEDVAGAGGDGNGLEIVGSAANLDDNYFGDGSAPLQGQPGDTGAEDINENIYDDDEGGREDVEMRNIGGDDEDNGGVDIPVAAENPVDEENDEDNGAGDQLQNV